MSKFSRVSFCLFVAWNDHTVVFLLILFYCYFCSVDPHVVCIVSSHCNQFSSALFYVIYELLYRCINAILNAGKSSSSFFPSRGYKGLCIVMSFLVLWSICWRSSLVHFLNSPDYLTRRTAPMFILLIRFLLYSLVSSILFCFFFYIYLFDGVHFHYSQVFVSFLFPERSDFFLVR